MSTIIRIVGKNKIIMRSPNIISHGKFLVYTGLNTPRSPNSGDFLEILGIILGDGHLFKNKPICIVTSTRIERAYYYFNLFRHYVEWIYVTKHPKRRENWSDEYYVVFRSREIVNKVRNIITGKLNISFFSHQEALKFLRGCLLTEGSVIYYDNGKLREIKFSNSDIVFIKYVVNALRLLGIKYHVTIDNRVDNKHKRRCYYVRIYGKHGLILLNSLDNYQ